MIKITCTCDSLSFPAEFIPSCTIEPDVLVDGSNG